MFEQGLGIDGFRFVVFLVFEGLSVPLVVHVVFFQGLELFDVLVPLYLVFVLDVDDFFLQFFSSFLLVFNGNYLLL